MVGPYLILLLVVTFERLVELALSHRNADWAFQRGGIEFGRRQLVPLKLLHTGLLVGCAAEVVLFDRPFFAPLGWPMLALVVCAEGLRYWAIATLGRRWSIRVIVLPDAPALATGPYRYLRHPNYAAVILEGMALPLVHSAWITALAFTALNGLLLWRRVRCEEDALSQHCRYQEVLGARPRLVPSKRGARAIEVQEVQR